MHILPHFLTELMHLTDVSAVAEYGVIPTELFYKRKKFS